MDAIKDLKKLPKMMDVINKNINELTPSEQHMLAHAIFHFMETIKPIYKRHKDK